MTMRAVVINGPGDLQVVDKPRPEPGPGEVLVKVKYCGICGSDLHACKTGMFPFGMTIGHEYAGVVEAAGPGVEGWRPGQKVTGTASLACRACRPCREGRDNICLAMNVVGVTREGAMAEYVKVPAESLFAIPEEMPFQWGTLVEPYSVALHGAALSGVEPGQKVVILGAGALGLCLLTELRRRGVGDVCVAEVNEARLKAAASMGATATVNHRRESLDGRIAELTGGAGADLVFECAGLPETIREAGNLVRQGGTVVILGICEAPVELFFLGLVTREIRLVSSYGSTAEEFRRTLRFFAEGAVRPEPLITRQVPFEQAWEQGFKPLLEEGCPDIKVLVEME